ncbi:hypothetical protein CC2G_010046 [Coprinopsis cinerea AmutBmut pab1-1]|nr:hypothetical protein CC2G_010046 [Coprinopsis cinerea AmutBmut pab1-1]
MVLFGLFSRKPAQPEPEPEPEQQQPQQEEQPAGSASSSAQPFVFPQRQLHTPAPSLSFSTPPVARSDSTPADPPPRTPSPLPDANAAPAEDPEPPVTDPRELHSLISSVPPQTLHGYCLDLLDPVAFDTAIGKPKAPKRRRRKSALVPAEDANAAAASEPPLKPHSLLTPEVLKSLTAFFKTLVPPPQLHCVRCHKAYFELENTDYSCRVPHDDASTVVERVGTKLVQSSDEEDEGKEGSGDDDEYVDSGSDAEEGKKRRRPRKSIVPTKSSVYETFWGCCGQTVEGDGDQGPPDGWCYEGRHTTDYKRARFRADSTPQDDKLVSCHRLKCFRPPVSQGSTVASSVRSPPAARKRKRNVKSVDYREPDDDDDMEGPDEEKPGDDDDDAKSTTSVKRRRKDSSGAVISSKGKGKGPGRPRKRTIKSKEEVDDEADQDAMDVDQPPAATSISAIGSIPRSPPASPRRKPVSSASTASTSVSAPPGPLKKKAAMKPKPKALPSPKAGGNTKPATPSPLGARQDTADLEDEDDDAETLTHRRSRSQVFVEVPTRSASKSPVRGSTSATPNSKSTFRMKSKSSPANDTRMAAVETVLSKSVAVVKAKGSVASLRDKFERGNATDREEGSNVHVKAKQKRKQLQEVVASSVPNEVEMQ